MSLIVYRDSEVLPGPENMARDEALFDEFAGGDRLVVRFYGWRGLWHSVGYFQRERLRDLESRDLQVVRRRTGGGEVIHDESEGTYSLIVPSGHAASRLSAVDLYRWVHTAMSEALGSVGMETSLAVGKASGERPGACFIDAPVPADVLHEGRKVAGAAMRRSHGAVMLQGSVRPIESVRAVWQEAFVERLSHL